MAKSSLTDVTILTDHYDSRGGSKIDKITIHHMAGNLSAEQCGYVFQTREASTNYGIDSNGRVGCYVLEEYRAWSTANYSNDRRAINIELANDEIGGNWHVSDKAIAKCIDLCVDICKRNGISRLNYTGNTSGNLTRHNMFMATTCPGPYLQSKFPYIANEVNKRLSGQPSGNVADYQRWLNSTYGYGLVVDNIFGPNTKKCAVKALQTEFNKQLGAGLTVDGIFGPNTKNACPNLEITDEGRITKNVQYMLITKGYSVGSYGADGIFGSATRTAVMNFQRNNGLTVDGIVGPNTFEKLFK